MHVEAVGEEQRRALLHVGGKIVLVDIGLKFVGRHHHHGVGPFCRFGSRHHLEARGLRLLCAGAGTGRDDDLLHAAIAHIERVGVALRAEADDGDLLVGDEFQIGIPIIIDAHSLAPAYYRFPNCFD